MFGLIWWVGCRRGVGRAVPNPYLPALIAELRAHGITETWVDRAHPHPRLYWRHDGCRRFYVVPSTPGDRRGVDNALSDLRRVLGVKRITRHSDRPARRRNRTKAAVALTLTCRSDPMAALDGLAADIRRADIMAGVRLWHAGVGLSGHETADVRWGWWRAARAEGLVDALH